MSDTNELRERLRADILATHEADLAREAERKAQAAREAVGAAIVRGFETMLPTDAELNAAIADAVTAGHRTTAAVAAELERLHPSTAKLPDLHARIRARLAGRR